MKLSVLTATAAFVLVVLCIGTAQGLTYIAWKGKATATVDSSRYNDDGERVSNVVGGTADVTLSGTLFRSLIDYYWNGDFSFVDKSNGVRINSVPFGDEGITQLPDGRISMRNRAEADVDVNGHALGYADVQLIIGKKGETTLQISEGDWPCERWYYSVAPGDYHGMVKAK